MPCGMAGRFALRTKPARSNLLPAETGFAQPGLYAARLLISAARAATLKLTNQREAAEPHAPVMMHGAEPFSLHAARTLADPALDLAEPMRGPFRADAVEAHAAAAAAALDHGAVGGNPACVHGGNRG